MSSEIFGNQVPQRTMKQSSTKSRLLKRKLDSREISDSSLCSVFKCLLFFIKKKRKTARLMPRNHANQFPIEDCAKAWTELMMPLRVRNVPRIASQKQAKTNHMFQIFSMPRFSCIMTECRKAVPTSQGIREAFSTGSHPQ